MTSTLRIRLTAIMISLMVSLVCAPAVSAQVERGQKSFGPKVGFVSRNASATAGLTFGYAFSRHVRVVPEVGLIFRHKDLDGLTADINVHFPVGFASGKASFYPLVGVSFASWGRHSVDMSDNKDVTTHINVFGLNAGAGVEVYCTSTLKLSLEGRYTLMHHYPTAFVTAGIAFVF